MARCSSLFFRSGLLLAVFAFLAACAPPPEFPIVKEREIEYGNGRMAGSVIIRVPQLWVDGRDTAEAAIFTVPLGLFKTGEVLSVREELIAATPVDGAAPGLYEARFDFGGIPRDEYEIRLLKEVPPSYLNPEKAWDSSYHRVLFTCAKYKLTRSDPERLDIAEEWNLTSATDTGVASGTVLIDGYLNPGMAFKCQPTGSGWALPLYWVSRMEDAQHGRVDYSLRGLPYAEYEFPMSGTYGLDGRAIADMPNPVLSSANPEAKSISLGLKNVGGQRYCVSGKGITGIILRRF